MKLLPIITAAAVAASCGFANAQATNFSVTPGDAKSLSGSGTDVRDYRAATQRHAMEQRRMNGWGATGYYAPGYNAFGAGVGPLAFGVGAPYGVGIGVGAWPEYSYRAEYDQWNWPHAGFYGPAHRY